MTLRDQRPLLKRRDLSSLMGDGLTIANWIGLLNRRVYLFADSAGMKKLLKKYAELDGAKEVITFSPRRLTEACRPRVELSAHNSGAVARVSGVQKYPDTSNPWARFPPTRDQPK